MNLNNKNKSDGQDSYKEKEVMDTHLRPDLELSLDFILDLLDASSLAAIIHEEGIILNANKNLEEMFGYTIEEALKKNIFEYILPEYQDTIIKSMKEESKAPSELAIKRKDGKAIPVEASARTIPIPGRKFRIVIMRDLSEKKDAERAIIEGEEDRDRIFNLTLDMICKAGFDGYFKWLNPAWERTLGFTNEELMAKPFIEFVHPSDRRATIKGWEDLACGKSVIDFENRYICRNGSYKWISWRSTPVVEEQMIYTIGRDITEQKKAREKIENSEETLRDFLLNANDLIQIIYPTGKIKFVNNTWLEVLGYTREEAYELNFTDVLHEGYIAHCTELFRRLSRGESFTGVEVCFISKDGKPIYVEGNINGRFENGEFISTRGIFRDNTARKKQEERIRKLTQAVEQSPVSIVITDTEGTIEYVNQKFQQITGYSKEEAIGKNPKVLKSGIHSQEYYRELWDTIKSGKIWNGEFLNKRKNGDFFWESATISPIKDKEDKITHFLGIKEDITDKKQLEENLQRENAKMSTMLSNIEEGIVFADADGVIVEVNDYFCKFFNMNREQILGGELEDLYLGEIPGGINSLIEKARNHPDTAPLSMELSLRGAEVILKVQPIFRGNEYDGVLLSIVNVTELVSARKQADKARHEAETARQEAERANKSKSEFLANMSHEIRTPMNAIMGFSDLLLEMNLTFEKRDYINMIKDSGDHLLMLINDILDLSRVESGKMEIIEAPFNIREMTKDTMGLFQPIVRGKGIRAKLLIDEDIPEILVGDKKHITQIIINLLSNAVKFTLKGKITLTISESYKIKYKPGIFSFCIEVADTGVGIPRKKIETIFDPFERGSMSTNREFSGTGLGLAITKRMVELMGGMIAVESNEGTGSTFTINLPLKIQETTKPEYSDKEVIPREKKSGETDIVTAPEVSKIKKKLDNKVGQVPGAKKSKFHILLVEDLPINQKLIKTYLKHTGYDLSIASNGVEAVEMAEKYVYNLIFMDVQLPGMDGYTAARKIKKIKDYKDIPIIALTAHTMRREAQEAREVGCDEYLLKPIAKKKLLDTIKKYFEKAKSKPAPQMKKERYVHPDIAHLVPQYVEFLNEELQDIKEAFENNEIETVRIKGHSLKGSGAGYGFEEITQTGGEIEQAAVDKDVKSLKNFIKRLEADMFKINRE